MVLIELWLILFVIYGFECLVWLPHGTLAFTALFGARHKAVLPFQLLSNERGGLRFGHLLPGRFAYHCGALPLSISPQGIYAFTAATGKSARRPVQSRTWVPAKSWRRLRIEGNELFWGRKLVARFASQSQARTTLKWLENMAKWGESSLKKGLAQSFDSHRAAWKLRWFQQRVRRLRRRCWALFGFLFLILPAAYLLAGWWLGTWLILLLIYAGLLSFIIREFIKMHRRIDPHGRGDRWQHGFMMALAPTAAIRAATLLSQNLLAKMHPLAVAKLLLPHEDFSGLAEIYLRDIHHPLPAREHTKTEAQATEVQYREAVKSAIHQFLKEAGLDAAELLKPPEAPHDQMAAYCPRCHQWFQSLGGICRTCGGMEPTALTPSPAIDT